jgi:hypothetical protein
MLSDPYLLEAVKQTNAVVFLDTAARFMVTNDENSAAQNRKLVDDVIALQAAGAVAVILNHHATKASQNEAMTLENMLRGTGDFAAMTDMVYGIRKDRATYANGNGPMEIELVSLKDREQIGALTKLRLAASRLADKGPFPTVSIIDEMADFKVINKDAEGRRQMTTLVSMVENDPNIKARDIAAALNMKEYTVRNQLNKMGWHAVQGGKGGSSPWHRDEGRQRPYEKKDEVRKPGLKGAVAFLTEQFADLEPYEYVPEAEIYQEADKLGISDSLLTKARKRLNVVIDAKDRGWSLPTPTEHDGGADSAEAAIA